MENKTLRPNAKTAYTITLCLVRHVASLALTVMLPTYIIATLAPLALYNREDLNDVMSYLATLLLTLTAHRQIIDAATINIDKFTPVDRDFLFSLFAIIGQTVFVVLDWRFGHHSVDQYLDTIFLTQECLYVLVACFRFGQLFVSSRDVPGSSVPVSFEVNHLLTLSEYSWLTAKGRKMMHQKTGSLKISQKTYFSLNVKLLLARSKVNNYHRSLNFPTNDLFRTRITLDTASESLAELLRNGFQEYYRKDFKSKAAKVVFVYEDEQQNRAPLEVQVVKDMELMRLGDESLRNQPDRHANVDGENSRLVIPHFEYKKSVIYRHVNRSCMSEIGVWYLTKLLVVSIVYNFFHCNLHGIAEDIRYFKLLKGVINENDRQTRSCSCWLFGSCCRKPDDMPSKKRETKNQKAEELYQFLSSALKEN
jgi:hypothetical protein